MDGKSRETLSQYCAELEDCLKQKIDYYFELKGKTGKEYDDALEKFLPPYSTLSKEVLKLQSKALLYLNSNDKMHSQIEDLLKKNSQLLHKRDENNYQEIRRNIEEIIFISKDIFKLEWKRSKNLYKI
jgi:hypothetical protein